MNHILFCQIAILLWSSSAHGRQFCTNIYVASQNNTVSKKSVGYFWMMVDNGTAEYSYNIDLSSVINCNLTLYPSVGYHIHTSTLSGSSMHSCANTGSHYDPNLACSESSEFHGSLCKALNRTTVNGYQYRCRTVPPRDKYVSPTGTCEVGDLSGKFGKTAVGMRRIIRTHSNLIDVLPPYQYNFRTETPLISAGWSSVVFHCGNPSGTRIACGDFRVVCGIRMETETERTAKPCPQWC